MKKEILFNIIVIIIVITIFIYALLQVNGYIYTISPTDRNNPVVIQKTGSLSIHSNPEGATVLIDGIEYKTPAILKSLAQQDYKIVIQKLGYEDYETTISIVPGEVKLIEARLISQQTPVDYAQISPKDLISRNLQTNELFVLNKKGNILNFEIFKFTKDILPFSETRIAKRDIYLNLRHDLTIKSFNCQSSLCVLFTTDSIYLVNLETGTLDSMQINEDKLDYEAEFVEDGKRLILQSSSAFYLINTISQTFEISYIPEDSSIINYIYSTIDNIMLLTKDKSTQKITLRKL